MTNLETVKKFSQETGITDPVVDTYLEMQETYIGNYGFDYGYTTEPNYSIAWPSWIEEKKHTTITAKTFKEQYEGSWPDRDDEDMKREYEDFSYRPHKAQRGFFENQRREAKKKREFFENQREATRRAWTIFEDAAFDWAYFDEAPDTYDMNNQWRKMDKPLMLPEHKES